MCEQPPPKTCEGIVREINKQEYDRLWEYFKYHAEQRLTTFRFFFATVGVFAGGFIAFLVKETVDCTPSLTLSCVMLGVGVITIIFSIVFWILDNRNNKMIKTSRNKLIELERECNIFKFQIFKEVENDTKNENRIRFHQCFHTIFITFIIIGIIIIFYSLCNLIRISYCQ